MPLSIFRRKSKGRKEEVTSGLKAKEIVGKSEQFASEIACPCDKSFSSLHVSPLQVLKGCYKISLEPSLPQPEQLNSLRLCPQQSPSTPVINSVIPWTHSYRSAPFLYWGSQTWRQEPGWGLTGADLRGRITSLHLLVTPPLVQPRMQLAY